MLFAGPSTLRRAALALALLLLALPARPLVAQGPPRQDSGQARPKLVVILVVDQMRADYPVRYGGLLEKGLKRLTTQGAWFQNAAYPYMSTLTCVGHTTIGTGTLPYHHGIIQNAWYDRATSKSVTCTEDAETSEVSYAALSGIGDSARRMLTPSLAETMKKDANTRVVTLSIKARSAIGLAGHAASDATTWFDERGAWETSTAFAKAPVGWVANFVKANPVERDAGKSWERTLPEDRYTGADDAPGERGATGWGAKFPHVLGEAGDRAYYAHWLTSPYADEYLELMAEAAIDENHLGKGDGIDFLGVSFSTLDLIGHAYGPRSHEVQDEIVRLDRTLGKLLDHLDEKVGAGNYVLALSADHGVADLPEQAENGGRVLSNVVSSSIDAVLKAAGYGEGGFVAASVGSDVYLKPGVYDRLHDDKPTAKALLDAMGKLSGVARVLLADDLSTPAARQSKDPQIRAAALSYFAGRSGDLIVIPKENWIMGASITTHGTLNAYDQRVPVILFGAGIRPGLRPEPATPADIVPTLAALAGIKLEPVDGKVLTPALKK
jgi:predicted AlkP superfamily pyrophosphatase or phosphodiesterase